LNLIDGGLKPVIRGRGWSLFRNTYPAQAFARYAISRAVNPLRQNATTVAISEENLLGDSRGLLTQTFYPDAAIRLKPFETLARSAELHIFLSVRSFDEIIPAAYAQVLKDKLFRPGTDISFEPIGAKFRAKSPSWTELIRRLRVALPSAHLKVWRFEDYLDYKSLVLTELCGVRVDCETVLPPPRLTQTPSHGAIKRMEELDSSLPIEEYQSAIEEIIKTDTDRGKFRPFTDEETRRLRHAYDEDLRELEETFPGVLLMF